MSVRYWVVGALALALAGPAEAGAAFREAGTFGIGGTTTLGALGLSGKYFMSEQRALQFRGTAGFTRIGEVSYGGGSFGVDYLLQKPLLQRESRYDVAWNIGAGVTGSRYGSSSLEDDAFENFNALSVAGLAGLEFGFANVPVDVVAECRSTLYLSGAGFWGLALVNTGFHVRYYFL